MRHLHQIFEKLKLSRDNGLFITAENNWSGLFSNRVERILCEIIQPDAFFCIDKKPFILFFDNILDKKEKLKEIWNFNESPIVIISEGDSIEIYNGFEYLSKDETLRLFGTAETLNDFSYFQLVTGKTWEKYEYDFRYSNRIDYHLLENIKTTRNLLISEGLSTELTNSLLGKIIFVRYLIDREVKLDFEKEGKSRKWTNSEFCNLLAEKNKVKDFFSYLKKKFNGDLFPISQNEIDSISENSFSIVQNLLSGNEVSSGQQSLFNLYDFSIIPVEFISNVYELFIGQNEQENEGAYYTPLFLVDYILSETVESKFRKNQESFSCKVLDPSCGSGIFLVETLRKIIEQFQKNHPSFQDEPTKYKEQLKTLALDNIFGIDKDQNAVNVAIFSIYLTLLDYQKPSDIESFKFPLLYKRNFFSEDFFNEEAKFNSQFNGLEFDFILGNPPWKGNGIGKSGKEYLTNRLERERGITAYPVGINNGEIAEGFMLRVSDFSSSQTVIALITKSTILYNKGYSEYSKFRKYFLEEFYIKKVLELAPVRFEVFDKSNDPAVAPACVVFYKYALSLNTDKNSIEHLSLKPSRFFSLFKVFTINRSDYKKVDQEKLKHSDWLWKTLVYGSYLDFNFISRLKTDFTSIKELLSDSKKFKKGTGVKFSTNSKEDASHLLGKQFLDASGVEPFFVNPKKITVFQTDRVGRKRDSILFEGPLLLVRNGLDTHLFKPRAALINSDVVYKNSLTGIKPISNDGVSQLKNIVGNLYSDLYSYLAMNTFSSIGIEREQTKEYEKFDIPFVGSGLESIVDEIIKIKKLLYEEEQKPFTDIFKLNPLKETIKGKLNELNLKVFEELRIEDNSVESALIDYALKINRPLIARNKVDRTYKYPFEPLSAGDEYFNSYTTLFLNWFNNIYKEVDQKLIVKVKHNKYIVGMFFHLVPLTQDQDSLSYEEINDSDTLRILLSLGNEKVTDHLFIQKDIRGFEKDGFYVIKPNERKLWHQAMAHLDLNEFTEAILAAGRKNIINVQ